MRLIDAEPIIKNLSAMITHLGYDAIDIDGMIKALREAEEITASPPPTGGGLTLRTDSAERLELVKDIPTERLRELAQAEKGGRE